MPGTFAYNAGTDTITVTSGTSGAPATFNDMYLADVAGGWGQVTEVVADAMYKIDCNVNFGDGATSTYFQSQNECVHFSDAKLPIITANATLELGDLSGDWGINGSFWRWKASALHWIIGDGISGTFNCYASHLFIESVDAYTLFGGGVIDIRNSIISSTSTNYYGIMLGFNTTSITLKKLYVNNIYALTVRETPASMQDIHLHTTQGLALQYNPVTASGTYVTNSTYEVTTYQSDSILVDPTTNITLLALTDAGDSLIEQYTCNIHVADEDGADLETVTVQCQTFGNVVSNDAGATFYKCILDHTSGVFATDLTANKWELTTAAYAAKAGCTGSAANGAWVTGIAYVAAASEFSVATGSDGDIAEQTIDYKKWIGTSEVLLTYSPHTFTLTYDSDSRTIDDFTVDHPIVWHETFPGTSLMQDIYAATVTDAAGANIAADIIALKAETASILADTNEIQGKLPTNKIMGSSDVDNHDTTIDTINTNVANTIERLKRLGPTNQI